MDLLHNGEQNIQEGICLLCFLMDNKIIKMVDVEINSKGRDLECPECGAKATKLRK